MPIIPDLIDFADPDIAEDLESPIPTLYHYTDGKGFLGIIEEGVRLRATHFRFLNDLGEVAFGEHVVSGALHMLREEIGSDMLRQVEQRTHELAVGDHYFACLSERHDVLSQWRAYGDSGAGYCLGLCATQRLVGYGDNDDFCEDHLMKCKYGEAETQQWLVERFRRKLQIAGPIRDQENARWLVPELVRVAWRCLRHAKHSHFREEDEWRIVVRGPQEAVAFRAGPVGLTPYLMTEPLTLDEVWVGPRVGPSPEIARGTVERFLALHNIRAKVSCWDSPIAR